MEHTEKITVKVTNVMSGEILEKEISNAWDAKELFLQLNANMAAMKKAKEQIASYLDTYLGNDDLYEFADGKKLKRSQRSVTIWTPEGLKDVGLDEDAIASVSVISMPLARAVVDEMIERGDIKPDSKKSLNNMAIVNTSKPFVEIR